MPENLQHEGDETVGGTPLRDSRSTLQEETSGSPEKSRVRSENGAVGFWLVLPCVAKKEERERDGSLL